MFEQFAKVPSYFEWLVIASAFLSLILSLFAFLLVFFTRKRVQRAEELVKEIAAAVNKLSTDAHNASESAARAAMAAAESAKAARDSASASKDSVKIAEISAGTVNRAAELLTSSFDEERRGLGRVTELPASPLDTSKKQK